jgi:peptide/nickel transport system permease protein
MSLVASESDKTLSLRESFRRSWLRRLSQKPNAVAGGVVVLGTLLVAVFAPLIAPYSPTETFSQGTLQPPSLKFPFGTDEIGRDVFSRVVYGTRISVQVGIIAVSIALVVGTTIGLVVGYFGGFVDNAIMRLMDIMLAFPEILLAIAIVAILGPSLNNTMVAIGIAVIPVYARTVRSSVLSVVGQDYIEAARATGVSDLRIITRHVLPNVLSPIIVLSTVNVGTAILIAAGLSYVGLGAQPPTPEWGSMLSAARAYLSAAWWMSVFPGLAISLVVLAFNLLGDAVRDVADPHSRGYME